MSGIYNQLEANLSPPNEPQPIMHDLNGIELFLGDEYWEINGKIYSENSLECCRHILTEDE